MIHRSLDVDDTVSSHKEILMIINFTSLEWISMQSVRVVSS